MTFEEKQEKLTIEFKKHLRDIEDSYEQHLGETRARLVRAGFTTEYAKQNKGYVRKGYAVPGMTDLQELTKRAIESAKNKASKEATLTFRKTRTELIKQHVCSQKEQ